MDSYDFESGCNFPPLITRRYKKDLNITLQRYSPFKVSINPEEAHKEYCKEELKIEKAFKDHLKKKQDRFRRRLK